MPTTEIIQLALLGVTGMLFAAAFALGLHHMRAAGGQGGAVRLSHAASMGPRARGAVLAGTLLALAIFAWRAAEQRSLLLPLSNPFDAFLALGLLLVFVLIYFRWTRHLRGLSFFLLPMIVVVLVLGGVLAVVNAGAGGTRGEGVGGHQDYRNAWTLLHVVAIVAGSVCFALGCVGGAVYLLADRQLKRREVGHAAVAAPRWMGYPPLGSIEKFNRWMVYVGFPLLTVATLAGILRLAQNDAALDAGQSIKIIFGALAWAVYAVLLHVPLNPRFRGRRSAWLYIVGFALFMGAFAAARWN